MQPKHSNSYASTLSAKSIELYFPCDRRGAARYGQSSWHCESGYHAEAKIQGRCAKGG